MGWTPEQHIAAATWITAAAAAATLVVLLVTALYAARQVREARALRREQMRPYVVPSINVEQQILFLLSVENIGKTAAYNVKLEFDPPPHSTRWDIQSLRMLKEPVPTMPPGQKFRAYWERSLDVFDEENPYPHPMSYRVTATYEDHYGRAYGPESYILDFRVYGGQAAGLKGMTELVKVVQDLLTEHKKWTSGNHGLRAKTSSAIAEEHRGDRPWHIQKTRKTYQQEGLKAAILYWVTTWRRRYGLWSR